jgi:hypothetical protein
LAVSLWLQMDSVFKPEGATIDVPSWHPEPVAEIPKDMPNLLPTTMEDDDDSKSVSTIGSLEEERLQPHKDETLRR